MNILVTGGTGNVGERVVRRLIAGGHVVNVLSRRGSDDPVICELAPLGVRFFKGSAGDLPALQKAAESCGVLIGCAHVRFAEISVRLGISRYIQLSSTRRHTKFPCESSRQVIAGEEAIERSALSHTILRPTMIYGGRDDRNVSRVQAWFRKRRWIPMPREGKNLLQPVHVDDVVEAIIACLERPETTTRKSFDIGGGEEITYCDFLKRIAGSVGVSSPRLIRIPLTAALLAAPFIPNLSREQVQRLAEDKTVFIEAARTAFSFSPRQFLQ
ncbi:NAD-dependent epimerase/dehydratase family protein [Candidatus Sumerlaeota bacterium]|nr:NAD-dependent epimerase/dehydratase family protein [Candidatus Sumerlaeota bacterium]